jgi:acetyltransferase
MLKFHESLSDRSVYLRFLQPKRLSDRANHDRLSRICHSDYDNEIALIVEDPTAGEGQLRVLAASRMSKLHGTNAARLSMLITDCCQGMGIGRELMRKLIDVARQEKLNRLEILMTQDNHAMQSMCKSFGFEVSDMGEGLKRADLKLQ